MTEAKLHEGMVAFDHAKQEVCEDPSLFSDPLLSLEPDMDSRENYAGIRGTLTLTSDDDAIAAACNLRSWKRDRWFRVFQRDLLEAALRFLGRSPGRHVIPQRRVR